MDRTIGESDMPDSHAGPGWLAASGIACLLGRHWPVAAIRPGREDDSRSRCVDCGTAMERQLDGRWMAARLGHAIARDCRPGSPANRASL